MSRKDYMFSDEEKTIGVDVVHPGRRRLNNCLPLAQNPLNLNEDKIFEAAIDHQNWSYHKYTIKDLPPFDTCTTFGITVDDEHLCIREEIKKLVRFAGSRNPPPFDSLGALGGPNAAGVEDLSNVVDQIVCNMQILRHDNACVAMDHYVHKDFYDVLKSSRGVLRRRYHGSPRGITGNQPGILSGEKRNVKAYHALIDFIFQSFAWWIAHIANGKSWHVPIVAVLSRWSVKLKLIALDPVHQAEQTLLRGEEIMRRISDDQKTGEQIVVKFPSEDPEKDRKEVHFPEDRDLDYPYYYGKFHFRESIYTFVRLILQNLVAKKLSTGRLAKFEVRTLIYRGGLDETLRQLTVQQDEKVEMSLNLADLRRSYCALQLLLSNTRNIYQMNVDDSSSEVAKIHWHHKRVKCFDAPIGPASTDRLDDVVSALVPLSLMGSSSLVESLENLLIRIEPGCNDDFVPEAHELSPEEPLRIEFSLSTRSKMHDPSQMVGSDIVPTSRSPLVTSIEDLDKDLRDYNISNGSSSEANLKRAALRHLKEYKTRKMEIDNWTITEDSVRVHTTKYSSVVLAIAIAIIGGSLSVPFLVGERITGVDPFQFVTFGWLLTGAFLIGAKSRYVENWDWHDFLRGQVVCRSVLELAEASRVKPQAVFLYLLHHEFRNPLVYRGPYHGIFHRRAESGAKGFSIDVPVEHATVLAAGFIVQEIRYTDKKEGKGKKAHILLHDTREDAHNDARGEIIVSDSIEEVLGSKGEKQKSGCKKRVWLKLEKDRSMVREDVEVMGLPTVDYHFT